MGRHKRSRAQTRAAKQSGRQASSRFPIKISLAASGILLLAGLALVAARHWPARPSEKIPVTVAQASGATTPRAGQSDSGAASLMGLDPSKEFVPGPVAANASDGTSRREIPQPVPGFDGLITLDPMCERLSSPPPKLPPGNPAPSTRRMVHRLADIRAHQDPAAMLYLSDRRADMLQAQLTNTSRVDERFRLQCQLALQQINAARPDAALNTFSSIERLLS